MTMVMAAMAAVAVVVAAAGARKPSSRQRLLAEVPTRCGMVTYEWRTK